MDSKHIGKAIRKNAKKVIAESGMGSSRSGNKELSHLVTRLSHQSIHSLENAQVLGARLGEKIVELSKASSKNHLDKGIIRTLVVTKAVPSVADLPTATALVNVPESKTRQTSKVSSPVASSLSVEQVQPTVLPADEPDIEDETSATGAEFAEDITSKAPSTQVVEETEVEEDEEDVDEDDEDDVDEDEVAVELLEEPTKAIQAEASTAPIAFDAVDKPITAAELDEEPATEIVSAP
jgi:hypothetical protein